MKNATALKVKSFNRPTTPVSMFEPLEARRFLSVTCATPDVIPTASTAAIVVPAVISPADVSPALTPTVIKSTLPTNILSGTAISGTLTYNVTNSSAAQIKGKSTIEVFATTTGVIDSASQSIGSATPVVSLNAGKSTKVAVHIKKVTFASGTYNLIARTTDLAGDVTDATVGTPLAVAPAFVSLAATTSDVSPTQLKVAKTTGKVKVTITNSGNIDATGAASISFSLSTDGTADSISVKSFPKNNLKIKANGKATAVTLTFKIPKGSLAVGKYFGRVTVTQGNNIATAVTADQFTVLNPNVLG